MPLCSTSIVNIVSQLPKQIHYLPDNTLMSLSLCPQLPYTNLIYCQFLSYLNQKFSFRVILPPRGHLATSKDTLVVATGWGMLLASSG